MGRKSITEQAHLALLQSFRNAPGDISAAAKAAGVDRRTARRSWSKGWNDRRSIKAILDEEMVLARAALQRERVRTERENAALLAAEDASESRAREARLARETQVLLMASVPSMAHMVRFAAKQGEQLKDDPELKPAERAALMRSSHSMVKEFAEAVHEVFRLERLRLGEPGAILGLQRLPDAEETAPTVEVVREELAALQRALDAAPKANDDDTNGTAAH